LVFFVCVVASVSGYDCVAVVVVVCSCGCIHIVVVVVGVVSSVGTTAYCIAYTDGGVVAAFCFVLLL